MSTSVCSSSVSRLVALNLVGLQGLPAMWRLEGSICLVRAHTRAHTQAHTNTPRASAHMSTH